MVEQIDELDRRLADLRYSIGCLDSLCEDILVRCKLLQVCYEQRKEYQVDKKRWDEKQSMRGV